MPMALPRCNNRCNGFQQRSKTGVGRRKSWLVEMFFMIFMIAKWFLLMFLIICFWNRVWWFQNILMITIWFVKHGHSNKSRSDLVISNESSLTRGGQWQIAFDACHQNNKSFFEYDSVGGTTVCCLETLVELLQRYCCNHLSFPPKRV